MKTLRLGSKDPDVRKLQNMLTTAGHMLSPIDDIFGSKTDRAVREFQQKKGIKVDGIVGSGTWTYLEKAINENKIRIKTKILRKNSQDPLVKTLQERLTVYGYPIMPHTDFFGAKTDNAVRSFQLKNKLISDGIVGDATWLALGVINSEKSTTKPVNSFAGLMASIRMFAGPMTMLYVNMPQAKIDLRLQSKPVAQLTTSTKGLQFLYTREAWKGVSNRLHWPGGASGVTLGPGYDMKERTAAEITRDMIKIGVTPATAKSIAGAAGLKGDEAKKFCKSNRDLVTLTDKVEYKLMLFIVPQYERLARKKITVDLVQHEFDALVSFAYNLGQVWSSMANHINAGRINDAMTRMKAANKSGGKINDGLTKRRAMEIAIYTLGEYGQLRKV